jgi:hypothetical protein
VGPLDRCLLSRIADSNELNTITITSSFSTPMEDAKLQEQPRKKNGKFSKKPNLKTHEANIIHYSAADVAYLKLKNDQSTHKLMSANTNKASTSNPNGMICIHDSLFQFVEPISTVYSIQRKIETAFPQMFSFAEDNSYMTCNMCKAHISLAAKNYLWNTKQHVESCSTIKQVNFISTHIHFIICYFIIITFRSH